MSTVVVGVDTSESGRAALRWALAEAVARDVPVEAVRAWLVSSYGMYAPPGSSRELPDPQAASDAQLEADEEVKRARDQVPGADSLAVRAGAVMGPPAQVLVSVSRGAALVVVGTRGAGVLARTLVGSVSSAVLHHARCPVVVVPAGAQGPPEGARRVLVGVDHSSGSLTALRFAVQHARRHGATLVPVCAHEPVWVRPDGPDPAGLERNERQALLSAAESAGASDLLVEPEVVTGQSAAGLLALVRPGDELVVGSRGRGGFASLVLGSTSTQVVQHATCPVVVVPVGSRSGPVSRGPGAA